jgi:tRNA nucleotidyltransferase (CCA-adding enzyme)
VHDQPPQPIVLGRHLSHLGVQPGKEMGVLLKSLFELQLEGSFADLEGGLEAARKILSEQQSTELSS